MINVLVVGARGREHALSWKLSSSDKIDQVYTAPGNGGTSQNIELSVNDIEGLAKFAQDKNCFTVVGPEDPLAAGIVDAFIEKGLPIFGPTQNAAQLESSKIWAKEFMKRNSIPTADFQIFDDAQSAKDFDKSYYLSYSEKLLEFQSLYFENDLIKKKIENLKVFQIKNKDKEIKNLKIIRE